MYPILEYSSTYLIYEYYVYFHIKTIYITIIFVVNTWIFKYIPHTWIYMCILTVSVYTILLVSESVSSSESSTPSSFVRRSGSLMFVCESHTTFCCLESSIVFLRTRLSWARTAFSTFGLWISFLTTRNLTFSGSDFFHSMLQTSVTRLCLPLVPDVRLTSVDVSWRDN